MDISRICLDTTYELLFGVARVKKEIGEDALKTRFRSYSFYPMFQRMIEEINHA